MNADGSVNKYKDRLSQGNYSSTFFETFADTASARKINILSGIAASENLEISTTDVKAAFYTLPLRNYSSLTTTRSFAKYYAKNKDSMIFFIHDQLR